MCLLDKNINGYLIPFFEKEMEVTMPVLTPTSTPHSFRRDNVDLGNDFWKSQLKVRVHVGAYFEMAVQDTHLNRQLEGRLQKLIAQFWTDVDIHQC